MSVGPSGCPCLKLKKGQTDASISSPNLLDLPNSPTKTNTFQLFFLKIGAQFLPADFPTEGAFCCYFLVLCKTLECRLIVQIVIVGGYMDSGLSVFFPPFVLICGSAIGVTDNSCCFLPGEIHLATEEFPLRDRPNL